MLRRAGNFVLSYFQSVPPQEVEEQEEEAAQPQQPQQKQEQQLAERDQDPQQVGEHVEAMQEEAGQEKLDEQELPAGPHFPFLALPLELQVEVVSWVAKQGTGQDLLHCFLVSKAFGRSLTVDVFWRNLCVALFPDFTGEEKELEVYKLPDGRIAWKAVCQSQIMHIEHPPDVLNSIKEKSLEVDSSKLTVTKKLGNWRHCRVISSRTWCSGKHYWEATINYTRDQIFLGIVPHNVEGNVHGIVGHSNPGWCLIPYTGVILGNSSEDRTNPQPAGYEWVKAGDVIGMFLDIDAGHLEYWRNGKYLAGIHNMKSIQTQGPYYAAVSLMHEGESVTFNFFPSSRPAELSARMRAPSGQAK
ncbi:hypothetical protein QOT17_005396 [Balamuthia mandrillaris]